MFHISMSKDNFSYLLDGFSTKERIFFGIITFFKMLLIAIPPIFTSDLARCLFYGQKWWQYGFSLYDMTPFQLNPNFPILDPISHEWSWGLNTYDYGVFHLLFFAVASLFPNSAFIVKFILVCCDIVCFYFLLHFTPQKKYLAYSFYILMAPISALEGQVESITILFFLLGLYFYKEKNHPLLAYFIIAISFHWKIISVILLPYMLIDSLKARKLPWKEVAVFTMVFSLFWLIPLQEGEYLFNSIFFVGFSQYAKFGLTVWNPFYIGSFMLSRFLNISVGILILIIICQKILESHNIFYFIFYLPTLTLLTFFSFFYPFASAWSWFYYYPTIVIIPEHERDLIFLLLVFLCLFALFELSLAIIFLKIW